jgi:sugar phosphate isomerase/epimerase
MYNNRRSFLKLAGTLTAGVTIGGNLISCRTGAKLTSGARPFGLQLYTLRNEMAKDAKGTLRKVAALGYKQIESFEGAQGIFWGMGHIGFKSFMDELNMTIVSSHCDINKDFERKADEAAAIGMKYLVCPNYGAQKSLDDYRKAAAIFNARGEVCKKAGLRFAYHNHEYSFKALDNQLPQDIFITQTDKDKVDFEMDVYWVVTAGQDPLVWINKYPDRFKLFHIKDRKKDAGDKRAAFAELGTGFINYPEITALAQKKGNPYFIVEQDQSDAGPMIAVEQNAAYMKNLLLKK